jgi:hypothetical protein
VATAGLIPIIDNESRSVNITPFNYPNIPVPGIAALTISITKHISNTIFACFGICSPSINCIFLNYYYYKYQKL